MNEVSGGFPVRLGSALRVPSYAHRNWNIRGQLRQESEDAYQVEWAGGSPRQMQYVIEAVVRSGMGNYSQMLRDANARMVSRLARDKRGRINYLETGAGVSTLTVYDQLTQDGFDLERIHATLVEPSQERLESAVAKLEERGLKVGKNISMVVGKDTDVPKYVEPNSQHIVCSVAALHHHAYLDEPMQGLADATRPGGFISLADWHNSMWEHPSRVYSFLADHFDWPTKREDLKAFREMYPKANEPAPEKDETETEANRMIQRFWKGWESVRREAIAKDEFDPRDDIFMLEGHRPIGQYVSELREQGFETQTDYLSNTMITNPWPLIPTSGLLYLTVGQKV